LFWAIQRNARLGFFAGTAVGLLPLFWFALVMGPAQLYHSLFIFPVFELSGSAYLPISTAPSDLRSFFFLSIGAGVVNLIAAVVAVRQMEGARLFLAVAIVGAACLYYALSRFDGSHVVNAGLISISLSPISLQVLGRKFLAPRTTAVVATLIALTAVHAVYFATRDISIAICALRCEWTRPKRRDRESRWSQAIKASSFEMATGVFRSEDRV